MHQLVTAFNDVEAVYERIQQAQLPWVTALYGVASINASLETSLSTAKDVAVAIGNDCRPWLDMIRTIMQQGRAPSQRKLSMRLLRQHTARTTARKLDDMRRLTGTEAEMRTVDEVPTQLIACDQEVVFVVTERADTEAVEIRHPMVVRSLVDSFESSWRRGVPAEKWHKSAPNDMLLDVEVSIMRRLVNGDTEEKIGRDLGMSRRTVAAHVARISKRFGSVSRAQLGYLIAMHGVLAEGLEPAVARSPD